MGALAPWWHLRGRIRQRERRVRVELPAAIDQISDDPYEGAPGGGGFSGPTDDYGAGGFGPVGFGPDTDPGGF